MVPCNWSRRAPRSREVAVPFDRVRQAPS